MDSVVGQVAQQLIIFVAGVSQVEANETNRLFAHAFAFLDWHDLEHGSNELGIEGLLVKVAIRSYLLVSCLIAACLVDLSERDGQLSVRRSVALRIAEDETDS